MSSKAGKTISASAEVILIRLLTTRSQLMALHMRVQTDRSETIMPILSSIPTIRFGMILMVMKQAG